MLGSGDFGLATLVVLVLCIFRGREGVCNTAGGDIGGIPAWVEVVVEHRRRSPSVYGDSPTPLVLPPLTCGDEQQSCEINIGTSAPVLVARTPTATLALVLVLEKREN